MINAAAVELPNLWETSGYKYLSLDWQETDDQVLFDPALKIVERIFKFIEDALNAGDSVLIFSKRGQSRACCVLTCYLMRRFKWNLLKTLEFLNYRRPDLEIRASFFHQLTSLESKLMRKFGTTLFTSSWENKSKDLDEIMMTNTYLNATTNKPDKKLGTRGIKELLESMQHRDPSSKKAAPKNRSFTLEKKRLAWADQLGDKKFKNGKNNINEFKSILKGSNRVFNSNGDQKKKKKFHLF